MSGPRQTVTDIPEAKKDKHLRMSCARCGNRSSWRSFASTNRWCRSCGIWFHRECSSHVMGKPYCPVCRGKIRRLYNPLITVIAIVMLLLAVVICVDAVPKAIRLNGLTGMERTYVVEVDDLEPGEFVRITGDITCPATKPGCTAMEVKMSIGNTLLGGAGTEVGVNDFRVCDETACVNIWPETLTLSSDQFMYQGMHGGNYIDGDKVVLWGKVITGTGGSNALKLSTAAPSMTDVNADTYFYIGITIGGIAILAIAGYAIGKQVTGLSDLDRHERYMRNVKHAPKAEAPARPPGWKGIYHDEKGEGED